MSKSKNKGNLYVIKVYTWIFSALFYANTLLLNTYFILPISWAEISTAPTPEPKCSSKREGTNKHPRMIVVRTIELVRTRFHRIQYNPAASTRKTCTLFRFTDSRMRHRRWGADWQCGKQCQEARFGSISVWLVQTLTEWVLCCRIFQTFVRHVRIQGLPKIRIANISMKTLKI